MHKLSHGVIIHTATNVVGDGMLLHQVPPLSKPQAPTLHATVRKLTELLMVEFGVPTNTLPSLHPPEQLYGR